MNNPPTVTLMQTADPAAPAAPAAAAPVKPIGRPGTIVDAKGRTITVKALDPLQVYRLAKVMGTAADSDFARGYAALAACVREIDGEPEPFPNSDREIEAMMQRLGTEGLEAVNQALADLQAAKPKTNTDAVKN